MKQVISKDISKMLIEGIPYVLLSEKKYQALIDELEDLEDHKAYVAAKKEWVKDNYRTYPFALAEQIIRGENPIKVYREHMGISQSELARRVGVASTYITMIEGKKRKGNVKTLKKIAAALQVSLDDLT